MEYSDLLEIWKEYKSYEGTCNNSVNKNDVAVNNFTSVLSAAMSLASELEGLKKGRNQAKCLSSNLTAEDVFLMGGDDDEPDEEKQTADFARYG
tara:strand:+ start:233 stop:514 length:282 start_codon:yes stop_codon:yes gene_type:complete